MKKFAQKCASWLRSNVQGQGMVEYGLIIAGVALVVIIAIVAFGDDLKGVFEDLSDRLQNPTVTEA